MASSPDARAIDAPVIDAAPDAPDAPRTTCDPMTPFSAPVLLGGLASADSELAARLSPDELTVVFAATYGSATNSDIYRATRASKDVGFGAGTPLAVNDPAEPDYAPMMSADGLTLVFSSGRVVNEGTHLYVSTRASLLAEFGTPAQIAGVAATDVTNDDNQPFLTADGQELWFVSNRGGNYDIYRATLDGASFATPTPVPELASTAIEWFPVLSADKLTIYFASARPGDGTKGYRDVWMAHRSSVTDGFGAPVHIPEVSTADQDAPTWLSPDNCRLYLWRSSGASTASDIYVASRQP